MSAPKTRTVSYDCGDGLLSYDRWSGVPHDTEDGDCYIEWMWWVGDLDKHTEIVVGSLTTAEANAIVDIIVGSRLRAGYEEVAP